MYVVFQKKKIQTEMNNTTKLYDPRPLSIYQLETEFINCKMSRLIFRPFLKWTLWLTVRNAKTLLVHIDTFIVTPLHFSSLIAH